MNDPDDSPRLRIFNDTILRHVDAALEWWNQEPNPPCTPWCRETHDPNEFRVMGLFTCSRDFVAPSTAGGQLRVSVAQSRFPSEATLLELTSDGAEISVSGVLEELAPVDAQTLAFLLVQAADFVREQTS